MGFWQRVKRALGFGRDTPETPSVGRGRRRYQPPSDKPKPGQVESNGLPAGWHFVGLVDDNGKTEHVDDSVSDQQIRDADRVFIAKTWPDGHTSYRQFSRARDKEAIGDMLIRESGEGSPV